MSLQNPPKYRQMGNFLAVQPIGTKSMESLQDVEFDDI